MKLVPDSFEVPTDITFDEFHLRVLSVDDLEEDYRAVMESVDELQGTFGKGNNWPAWNLTKKQDLIDLGWHEKEFQRRSSFAYAVEDERTRKYIGCLYIFPSDTRNYDADIYMWLRTPEYSKERVSSLRTRVEEWLTAWPFKKARFPDRYEADGLAQ